MGAPVMKTCKRCGLTKTRLACFNKNAALKDGYHCWCKLCVKHYNRAYRRDNREYISNLQRAIYQRRKENGVL